jgi:hypothetical protein
MTKSGATNQEAHGYPNSVRGTLDKRGGSFDIQELKDDGKNGPGL